MNGWLRHHVQSLGATLTRLARAPFATLLNTIAIGVTLALPLGAYIVLDNLQRLAHHVGSDPQMTIFMSLEAGKADVDKVQGALKQSPAVRDLRFVPRDAALAELKRTEGMAEILATLKSNPLPDAFIADLKPGMGPAVEQLAGTLKTLPNVAQVQLDTAWVKRLDAILRVGTLAVSLLAGLLAFGLVAVTFNTVRLQILTQRDEIEVHKLIGATDAYVRRPFFYLGVALGVLGGVAALGLIAAGVVLLNKEVAVLAATYASDFQLRLPGVLDLIAVLVFAAALGWTGAYLSVSRHLAAIQPR